MEDEMENGEDQADGRQHIDGYSKPDEDRIRNIIATFQQSYARHKTVVFCVRCGSTMIDQNSIASLVCYTCGNEMLWNAHRFSISRRDEFIDLQHAIENTVFSTEQDDWYIATETALSGVIRLLTESRLPLSPEETMQSRLTRIERVWETCKQDVDRLIATRKQQV